MKQVAKKTLGIAALGAAFTAAGAGVAAAQPADMGGAPAGDQAAPSPLQSAGKTLEAGGYAAGKAAGLDSMTGGKLMSAQEPMSADDSAPNNKGNLLGGLPLGGLPVG